MVYKRVLLKISGEALLAHDGKPIDQGFLTYLSKEIKPVFDAGVQIAIVVGGGNIFRGLNANTETGLDRVTGDHMGMLGTVINSLALKAAFEAHGMPARAMTAIEINKVAEPFIRGKALRHLEKGRIVIFAGGTGSPFFTTDTTASLRALETNCEAVLKATKVDGIYTDDPFKNPDAKRFETITFAEALSRKLKVMDSTAFSMCSDNNLPIIVFNFSDPASLEKVLAGDTSIATVVKNS